MNVKNMIRLVILVMFMGLGFSQTTAKSTADTESSGICSYYARRYDGRITAGGKRFSSNAMTAAHRTLPMGTKLKLTNLANNKSVVVTVNDRGTLRKGKGG